ncbi:TonB-dependent receptor domain-containing protein [Thalassospira marina]|uniref:TonB-dependent receptor n=1 Tax=Thalassospira marina TaxID=2048283 RepID=A0A2N3KXC6_9PROT|nr:TonB-dependent receptor [Thalassospira marina]PKR55214.1 TonB-dependent receptor [Thalassospira marina]
MPQHLLPLLFTTHLPLQRWIRTTLLTGVSIAAFPCVSLAQDNGSENSTAAKLDPITITADREAENAPLPGGVTIDQETLDAIAPRSLKDVFSGDAAVNVGGASPVTQKTYVQGIEDTKLNVTIDGTRQNNSNYHHLGTTIMDPGMLKQVDVETGVAPADSGPGALGGSIAYETRDARDIVEPGRTFGGYGKIAYDTNSQGLSEWLTIAGRSDSVEALAYLQNNNTNNYRDGNGDKVPGTANGSENGLGKFAFNGHDGERFEAFASHLEDEGVRPARPNFGALTGGQNPQWISYKKTAMGVSYVDEIPNGQLDPELSLNYSKSELDVPRLQSGPNYFHNQSEVETINGKVANNFDVGIGKVNTGIDFYHDEATGTHDNGARAGTYKEKSTNIGLFSQARLNLTDRWRTSFGGRFDRQWFTGIDGTEFDEQGLSANANTEYDILPNTTLYGGAGTAFGGLPIGESAIYNFTGVWDYSDFAPSRSFNYKAGSRVTFDRLTLDGNVFYNRIERSHDLSSVDRQTTADLVTRGINLSGTYQFDTAYIRTTYSHTIVRADGAPPVSTASAWQGVLLGDIITLDAGKEWRDLGLRAGMSSELALRNDDPKKYGEQPIDTYFVANLYGEWTPEMLSNAVTLRIDANNIFDRAYSNRTTTGYDSIRTEPYLDPGRSFILSAKVTF